MVSLPAVSRRMKNDASSDCVRASPSMLVVTSAVVRSSVGCSRRKAASSVMSAVSSWPASSMATRWSLPAGRYSGSSEEAITFEHRKTVACSEGGSPIMSQMISSESGPAKEVTKSHSPRSAARSMRPFGDPLDLLRDRTDLMRAEGLGDDPAQAGVAGVVGRDHAGEVLDHRVRQVDDADGALARAVDLRVSADLADVGMPGEGEVAGAPDVGQGRRSGEVGLRRRTPRGARRGGARRPAPARPAAVPRTPCRTGRWSRPSCTRRWSRPSP